MAIYENIKHITGSLNSEYEVKISIKTIITHVMPAKVRAMKPPKPVQSRGTPQYPSTNFILANECKCMCKTSESKTDIKVFNTNIICTIIYSYEHNLHDYLLICLVIYLSIILITSYTAKKKTDKKFRTSLTLTLQIGKVWIETR